MQISIDHLLLFEIKKEEVKEGKTGGTYFGIIYLRSEDL